MGNSAVFRHRVFLPRRGHEQLPPARAFLALPPVTARTLRAAPSCLGRSAASLLPATLFPTRKHEGSGPPTAAVSSPLVWIARR